MAKQKKSTRKTPNRRNLCRYMELEDLKKTLEHSLRWLDRVKGRFQHLLDINAPIVILENEHNLWDRHIGIVRDVIADGRLYLTDVGKRIWHEALGEYTRMPSMDALKPMLAEKYEAIHIACMKAHPELYKNA